MSSIINTNSLSLLTQNNLLKSQSSLTTAIQRLSSGLRINSAKDDAAGQAIANRFSSNIKGLGQAQRNANDGISLAQTTEGALNEINNNLQRVRELTVQAANGSNSKTDLDSIQSEITQRMAEIDRTSAQTDFNGTKVLGAAAGTLKIQVGANDGETIDIGLQTINTSTLGVASFNINGTGTANAATTKADLAMNTGWNSGGAVGTLGRQTAGAWAAGTADATTGAVAYTQTTNTITQAAVASTTVTYGAATTADVYGKVAALDTVKLNTSAAVADNYTVAGAAATLRFNSTEVASTTADATVNTALTPATGGLTNAVVQIGAGATQAIKIASDGKVTSSTDQLLYLDTVGNLSTTNAATSTLATVGGLVTSLGAVAGGSVTVTSATGSTVSYANAKAGADKWNITQSLTSTDMQAKSAAAGTAQVVIGTAPDAGTYDINNGAGTIKNGGTLVNKTDAGVDALNPNPGSLTTATSRATTTVGELSTNTTEVYSLKTNGNVFDASGNQVYTDATTVKGFSTAARNGTTSTVDAMKVIDAALAKVDGLRGSLGAVQNRFDSVISNLGSTITNLSASRSRIEDADYATEVSNMTRAQILQQAGTSVLAKANQSTQGVMSLLQ